METALSTAIDQKARDAGFDIVGFAPVTIGKREQDRLERFVANHEYGDMGWFPEKLARRRSPDALWPDVRSVVVLGLNYAPPDDPMAALDRPGHANISCYARNRDYHDLIKKRLKRVARWMVETHGGDVKVFVDTAPVLEKPLAALSGVGWQGKHTNLVSENFGSWLFLGEIYTTLDLARTPAHEDRCGSCRRCLDICPTDAFPTPYTLDARRCISYLTIEHKGPIPHEFRRPMGNRIYGCDDCLAVCPWNKFATPTKEPWFAARNPGHGSPLSEFLSMDDAAFRAAFSGSPVKRIGRDRFLRNVLIAAGNSTDRGLVPAIRKLLDDPAPVVRGAAVWALSELGEDMSAHDQRTTESDPAVLEEWSLALKSG
ncbi:MAG: tRNA epoxyqueuosine(34) reductase QueG [Alphaproteobacteria bacterium]